MQRNVVWGGVIALVCLTAPAAEAQTDQLVGFKFGYFSVRGEDARVADDVLLENLNVFAFQIGDFSNGTVGGEWLVGFGDFIEAGVDVGYYRRTVPTVYRDFIDIDGSEIFQDLRLRVVPITATARLFPFGREGGFQPYVGGGLGIFNWRYSETGEFIDFSDNSIFRDRFVANGTDVGPVAVFGARFPVGMDVLMGGEVRYQAAEGTVGLENGFLAERIDLGGYTTQVTFHVRF